MLHNNGIATTLLQNIFHCLGITVMTLHQANIIGQEQLLRKGERWEAQEATDIQRQIIAHKYELIDDFRQLGFIDKIVPIKKEYTYALVMGTVKDELLDCLIFLTELCMQGYKFEKIVLLGGERILLANEKGDLPVGIMTEAEMMLYLCENSPWLKDQNIVLINVPMVQKDDGFLVRPTTEDTLEGFKKILPEPGSCLVISHNPYIMRQVYVVKRILDQSVFSIEGAGPAFYWKDDLDIIMLMDELARTLYEEYKAYTAQK